MMLPIGNETLQQIRTAQERAVAGGSAAQRHVIASAGAGVAAIQHEFFGGQAAGMGFFVKQGGFFDHFRPARRRVNVHLNNAGVRCDQQFFQARITGRRVTFNDDRHFQGSRSGFNGAE